MYQKVHIEVQYRKYRNSIICDAELNLGTWRQEFAHLFLSVVGNVFRLVFRICPTEHLVSPSSTVIKVRLSYQAPSLNLIFLLIRTINTIIWIFLRSISERDQL